MNSQIESNSRQQAFAWTRFVERLAGGKIIGMAASVITPIRRGVTSRLVSAGSISVFLLMPLLISSAPETSGAELKAGPAVVLQSMMSGGGQNALAAISGASANALAAEAAVASAANAAAQNSTGASSSSPAAPAAAALPPQFAFYAANQKSNVFGANLFTGAFTRLGPTQFNPDYAVALGDGIQVRIWGSFQYDSVLTVDSKGNIFVPNVGPVHLLGVRNKDIQQVVEQAIRNVYRSNVLSYSALAAAQPVRVFVGGYVNLPGMYGGTSMDSVLNYLDQAGGIDTARGSFLKVQVMRGEQVRATFNLYDFLLQGRMPVVQLADGDVIIVSPRQSTFVVSGLASNANVFEFLGPTVPMEEVIRLAKPLPQVNHFMITHNNASSVQDTDYFSIDRVSQVQLQNGDEIQFNSDKQIGTISVRVQGEHQSSMVYVLPHDAKLSDVMNQIKFSRLSDPSNLQLFRLSVQARQAQQLQSLLQTLQANLLTARPGTAAEANLRTQEAALMLQWVDRAKQIQPTGQVLIAQDVKRGDLPLENGDVINIPSKDGLVMVSGQVLFPTTVAYDHSLGLDDYIRLCGGYTQTPDVARIIIAHRDGSFFDTGKGGFNSKAEMREGDTIMVLPYVDPKSRQFWLEMTQIISQVAISAKVVLGL